MTDVRRARHRTEAAREVIWSWRLSARSHRSVIHVNQRPTSVTSAKQTRPVTSSREFWTSSLVLWRQRLTSRMLLSVVLRYLSDKSTMILSSASLQTGTEADSGVKFFSQGSQSQRKTVEETIVSTRATWHREGRRKSRRVQKSRLSHRVKRPLTELKRCWADQGDPCLTRWSWITLLLYDETIPSVSFTPDVSNLSLQNFVTRTTDTSSHPKRIVSIREYVQWMTEYSKSVRARKIHSSESVEKWGNCTRLRCCTDWCKDFLAHAEILECRILRFVSSPFSQCWFERRQERRNLSCHGAGSSHFSSSPLTDICSRSIPPGDLLGIDVILPMSKRWRRGESYLAKLGQKQHLRLQDNFSTNNIDPLRALKKRQEKVITVTLEFQRLEESFVVSSLDDLSCTDQEIVAVIELK